MIYRALSFSSRSCKGHKTDITQVAHEDIKGIKELSPATPQSPPSDSTSAFVYYSVSIVGQLAGSGPVLSLETAVLRKSRHGFSSRSLLSSEEDRG